ncbi:MAG: hypothetical protein ACLT9U_08745 [Lentihominibacter sp.]
MSRTEGDGAEDKIQAASPQQQQKYRLRKPRRSPRRKPAAVETAQEEELERKVRFGRAGITRTDSQRGARSEPGNTARAGKLVDVGQVISMLQDDDKRCSDQEIGYVQGADRSFFAWNGCRGKSDNRRSNAYVGKRRGRHVRDRTDENRGDPPSMGRKTEKKCSRH